MVKVSLVAALAVLFSAWPQSQAQPDFSGRWVLASASPAVSDVPRALAVRQSLVSTNVRGEPITPVFKEITIEREVDNRRHSETYAIGVVGGVVHGRGAAGSAGGSREQYAVWWEGATLMFERSSSTGERPETGVRHEHREAWSLGDDSRLHIVITMRSTSEPTTTRVLVYRRAEDRRSR